MMKSSNLAAAGLGAVMAMSATAAGAVTLQSFETPVQPAASIRYGPDQDAFNTNAVGPVVMSGVAFNGFAGVTTNTASGFSTGGYWNNTPAGDQFAFLQSFNFVGASLGWTVAGLSVGTTYNLSFLDASGIAPVGEPFTVSAPGGPTTAYAPGASAWHSQTYSFTATTPTETITFADNQLAANQITGLDGFYLAAAVPEPTAWVMTIAGVFGLGAVLRRRRGHKAAAA